MKVFYTAVLIVVLLGGLAMHFWPAGNNAPLHTAQTTTQDHSLPVIAQEQYMRRDLPNGGVIFERIDPRTPQRAPADYATIAPAAGAGTEPQVKYEPLTQTFRRTVIDSDGNTRQDIIQHPANR